MTLAKRVRDCRYAKGWGPDELASRAEISRTALYQIESGKTELPRAGTLRRIAKALDVSIDVLLGNADLGMSQLSSFAQGASELAATPRAERTPETTIKDESSFARPVRSGEPYPSTSPQDETSEAGLGYRVQPRERDLTKKLHELLASPLGEGVARIVEESYRMLPMWHNE